MGTIRGVAAALATAAMVVACGGGSSGPTDPTGPDIRGTYAGTHTFSLQAADGDPFEVDCPGVIVVTMSSGGTFGGTLRIDECAFLGVDEPVTTPLSGTVQSDGAVRFTVVGQDGLAEGLEEEGCEVVEADEAFTGRVQGSMFSASLETTVRCDDIEGDVIVTWAFEGVASS